MMIQTITTIRAFGLCLVVFLCDFRIVLEEWGTGEKDCALICFGFSS